MKREKISNNKGITLIALVITIIVLLILAGVTIATLMGDNGILARTNTASIAQIEGRVNEEVKLAIQSAKMFSEEMATKTASGWLASENIGRISINENYEDMDPEQRMTVIGQMRADLTKEKGYIRIEELVIGGISRIKVTYQTDEYKKATNDSNAKIEIMVKVKGNKFILDEEKTIIKFIIEGTEYEAEEDMTWEEWIKSSYNVDGYYNKQMSVYNTVYEPGGRAVWLGSPVDISNKINVDVEYSLKYMISEPD